MIDATGCRELAAECRRANYPGPINLHRHRANVGQIGAQRRAPPSRCCDILRPSVIYPDTERFQTANSRVNFGTAAFFSFT
jgi:hypothetical protein